MNGLAGIVRRASDDRTATLRRVPSAQPCGMYPADAPFRVTTLLSGMLVYLHQYREADADESARAEAGDSVDHDTSEYFDVDSLETDEWERFEYDGREVMRKTVEYDGVTAVSVPKDHLEDEDRDVPGLTIQLRTQGGQEYVENARVVEVQEADPA